MTNKVQVVTLPCAEYTQKNLPVLSISFSHSKAPTRMQSVASGMCNHLQSSSPTRWHMVHVRGTIKSNLLFDYQHAIISPYFAFMQSSRDSFPSARDFLGSPTIYQMLRQTMIQFQLKWRLKQLQWYVACWWRNPKNDRVVWLPWMGSSFFLDGFNLNRANMVA